MKTLAAVALTALVLTGCGVQPTAVPQAASQQAPSAKAKRDHQQLYGIVVEAKIEKAQLTTLPGGQMVTATINVLKAVNTFDNSRVKGRIRITVGGPLNADVDLADLKAGATIQVFVDYPLIDRTTNTIVAQSRPYSSHGIKLLQGE